MNFSATLRLRWFCGLSAVFCGLLAKTPSTADEPAASKIISVWPADPPAWDAPSEPERDTSDAQSNLVAGQPLIRLGNVRKVELHVFEATDPEGKPSPTTVVICPGGGFSILAWDLEGLEIARQFQAGGVSAVVLKYRVPTRAMKPAWTPVLQDMQRAIALVRAGKVTSNIPTTVGLLGFSAGGKASAHAATAAQRAYESVDEYDAEISPPDFAALIYPAWIVEDDDPSKLRDSLAVDKNSPPMFFAHADNDPHQVLNSVTLFEKLHAAGVPAALHVFSGSGHGFGARMDGRADDLWPELCIRWIRDNGWLDASTR
jgi:endo-1,4-beta-xylanase